MTRTAPKDSSSIQGEKPPLKKLTIYDISNITGYSPGTVSRVLNNRDRVKDETREHILSVATKLNIQPRASVRTRQVAIITEPTFDDQVHGYSASLKAHLSFALSKRGIGISIPSDPFNELPTKFLEGAVAITYEPKLLAFLKELEKRIPIVYIDNFTKIRSQYFVNSDHYHAGYLAARHLIERGRTKLAFIGGNVAPFQERLRGFTKAMREEGVDINNRRIALFTTEHSYRSAVAGILQADTDAIYAPGASFEALKCLQTISYVARKKVPEDIALIGGENEGISNMTNPPLTTIEEPLCEIAQKAADMLDLLTRGKHVASPQIYLPVRLIARNSV